MTLDTTRKCSACKTDVPVEAAKCKQCGAWRDDIVNDINMSRLWGMAAVVTLLAMVFGMANGWWWPRSFEGLFTSPIGIGLIAAFLVCAAVSSKYNISANQKTGGQFWW